MYTIYNMASSQTWRFTRLAVCSLLLGSSLVSAQSAGTTSYSSAAPSNTSSPSSTSSGPITHTIDVGLGGFTFIPDVVQAEIGDFIRTWSLSCHCPGQTANIGGQSTTSFLRTTASSEHGTSTLAYHMKTQESIWSASLQASSPLTPFYPIHQRSQSG